METEHNFVERNFVGNEDTCKVYLTIDWGDADKVSKIFPTVVERGDGGWELLRWELSGLQYIAQFGIGVCASVSILELVKVEATKLDGTRIELQPEQALDFSSTRILDEGGDPLFLLSNHSAVVYFRCDKCVQSVVVKTRVLAHGKSATQQFELAILRRDLEVARRDLRSERENASKFYREAARALQKISHLERELAQVNEEKNVIAAGRAGIEKRLLATEFSLKNIKISTVKLPASATGLARFNRVNRLWRRVLSLNKIKQPAGRQDNGDAQSVSVEISDNQHSDSQDYSSYIRELVEKSGLFDAVAYRERYADVAESNCNPVEHFLTNGLYELRRPGPKFDPIFYLQNNPDVWGLNPLIHFLEFGKKEGRAGVDPKRLAGIVPRINEELYFSGGDSGFKGSFYSSLAFATKYKQSPIRPFDHSFNLNSLDIHWVIPDFSPGMGGHMTIFRMMRFLEEMGHRQTIWLRAPAVRRPAEQVQGQIREHFQPISPCIGFLEDRHPSSIAGDVVIATDRWTAYPVAAMSRFKGRFYFIQDYEPFFYPIGSEFFMAEQTYKLGLDPIVCSKWLESKMREFCDWTGRCHLAFDDEVYFARNEGSKPRDFYAFPRIAFYSRYATSRRCVELGMLALDILWRQGVRFEVDFFGSEFLEIEVQYPFVNHGILNHQQLAELYRNATIGMVFSATNYSLIPNEMMACGLPVLELDVESNRSEYPSGCIELVEPEPLAIVKKVISLLGDAEKRTRLTAEGLRWTSSLSWSKSAKEFESALRQRVATLQENIEIAGRYINRPLSTLLRKPRVSVIIPTFNGGELFKSVLEAIAKQKTPWDYEVVVIDSGSIDDTVKIAQDFARTFANTTVYSIRNEDFGHGRTRNLGAQLSRGDYLVLLTQDALPADDLWLYELVEAVAADDDIAGAFGRHIAYESADPFTKRDLSDHFEGLKNFPICNRNLDHRRYLTCDIGWRQVLHFFSDNSACLRRTAWEKFPYPDIEFGEDQAWAAIIIENGLSKAFAYDSVVYHSHDYNEVETEARAYTEALFFREMFGYILCKNEAECERNLDYLNQRDQLYAEEQSLSDDLLASRLRLNRARMLGTLRGSTTLSNKSFCVR